MDSLRSRLSPFLAFAGCRHRALSAFHRGHARGDGDLQHSRSLAARARFAGDSLLRRPEPGHVHRDRAPGSVARGARGLSAGARTIFRQSDPGRRARHSDRSPAHGCRIMLVDPFSNALRTRRRARGAVHLHRCRSCAGAIRRRLGVRRADHARDVRSSLIAARRRGDDAWLLARPGGLAGDPARSAARDVCRGEHRLGAEPGRVRSDSRLRRRDPDENRGPAYDRVAGVECGQPRSRRGGQPVDGGARHVGAGGGALAGERV